MLPEEIKVHGEMHGFSSDDIFPLFYDVAQRKTWDDYLTEHQIIQDFHPRPVQGVFVC